MPATYVGTFTVNEHGEFVPSDDVVFTPPASHELLTEIRDLIRDHPERHDQGHWVDNIFSAHVGGNVADLVKFADQDIPEYPVNPDNPVCGTTACVAGWAAIFGSPMGTEIRDGGYLFGSDGHRVGTAQGRAQDLLDLDGDQASYLFAGERTRDEVLTALDRLIDYPDAEIQDALPPEYVTYTVTVTDSEGNRVWSTEREVDNDPGDTYGMIDSALNDAYHEH
jgi:hypothetical protein